MKQLGPLVLAASAALGCGACSSSQELAVATRTSDAREVFGDIEQLEFGKRVQVRLPARLAVQDVSAQSEADRRRRLAATVAALSEDTATWSDVGSLHLGGDEVRHGATRFETFRAAASRQQADLLLVAERIETVRREGNGLGFLKILILPAFLVPTERVKTSVDIHTAAIDVRNGLVYATTDQHGERESHATWFRREDVHREQADELFGGALPGLRETLARKLRLLEGAGTR
jgi:hypothetical protein